MTDFVAGRPWPEEDTDHFWSVHQTQPEVGAATVTLASGAVHRHRNAGHRSGGGHLVELSYFYNVGAAGELHVIERDFTTFGPETAGRVRYPDGRLTERVARTYAPGTWVDAEGVYRPDISTIDPERNLIAASDGE